MSWQPAKHGTVIQAFRNRLADQLNTLVGVPGENIYISLDPTEAVDQPQAGQIVFVVSPGSSDVDQSQFAGGGNETIANDQMMLVTIHTFWDLEQADREEYWLGTDPKRSVMPWVQLVYKAMSGQILENEDSDQILNEPIFPAGTDFNPRARDNRFAQAAFKLNFDWDLNDIELSDFDGIF